LRSEEGKPRPTQPTSKPHDDRETHGGVTVGPRSKPRPADYARLKRKLYRYILITLLAAVVSVLLIDWVINGQVGERIVDFLQYSFNLTRSDAMKVYQYVIRNNMEIIIFVAMVISFLLLCRVMLSRFTRYFDEIDDGLDILVRDEDREIALSTEMEFMEHKLNALKRTLKQREEDARLTEQRKNDLVMYLAHDIKTPLTSIIGYLSLLDEAPDMPIEQKAKYVHITLEKAYRLEQLIDEFFEIARYDLPTMSLAKREIDLYYMLAQMAEEFYPLLAAHEQHLRVDAPEELVISGDPDKLARVFNNILKNAIAYSAPDSTISITATLSADGDNGANSAGSIGSIGSPGGTNSTSGIEGADRISGISGISGASGTLTADPDATGGINGTVTIAFKNEGSIPPGKLAAIFEKFYRLDDARSPDTGGAGLGLAIAREIILQHGGQIHAHSDETHTTFTVELPVSGDGETTRTAP
jgi:two-component system sensor histidine kinase VanS